MVYETEYVEFGPGLEALLDIIREIAEEHNVAVRTQECNSSWLSLYCQVNSHVEDTCKTFHICCIDELEEDNWFVCLQVQQKDNIIDYPLFPNDYEDEWEGFGRLLEVFVEALITQKD
jgi:hypothetical protein